MAFFEGGCLCGDVRYAAEAGPVRVTVCFCRACRRSTGMTGVVEPLFAQESFQVTFGRPTRYTQCEPDSGKSVAVSFCPTCGTKLFVEYGETACMIGVYANTLDEANWFEQTQCETRYVFLDEGGARAPAFADRRTIDGAASPAR